VSAFPVLDETGQVIGVVSEFDLLTKLVLAYAEERSPGMIVDLLHQHQMEKAHAVNAEDLMTSPAGTVSPDDTLEKAARLRYVRRVKRLPIVDADDQLARIISRTDVPVHPAADLRHPQPGTVMLEQWRQQRVLVGSPGVEVRRMAGAVGRQSSDQMYLSATWPAL
jgi:CBS-domain-containing membrane protein